MAFGGGGSSTPETLSHTHNAALAGDGGDLSETLTDMNGVALYSLITDNSAAVAANTAAIAAINSVPSGLVGIWTRSIASIPSGWTFYRDIPSNSSQLTATDNRSLGVATPRTQLGQQFNTGNSLVGFNPSSVNWYLYATGSPTGNVNSYIENSSGVIRETSTTTLDSSTLTGSSVAYEFTFAGTTTLAAGDMLTIKYDSGDGANYVSVTTDNTGAVTNSIMRQYSGSWADIAGEAMTYVISWNESYIKKT